MTGALIAIALLIAIASAWLLATNANKFLAILLLAGSLVVLLVAQVPVKAAFTWLAIVGPAGFAATIVRGLRASADESVS